MGRGQKHQRLPMNYYSQFTVKANEKHSWLLFSSLKYVRTHSAWQTGTSDCTYHTTENARLNRDVFERRDCISIIE